MQGLTINLEEIEGLRRRLSVSLSGDRLAYYLELAGEGNEGPDLVDAVSRHSFQEAAEHLGLGEVTEPLFEDVAHDPQQSHEYVALFEVYPDIAVPDVKGIRIDLPKASIDDSDVERTLTKLRRQHSRWQEVEQPAAMGDCVTVDLKASIDGIDVDETDVDVTLGEEVLLEGLDEGLIGAKAGDELKLELRFPDEFFPDLAGKSGQFDVKVRKVEALVLPELDEEFIRNHGLQSGKLENFRMAIRDNMENQVRDAIKMKTTLQIMADLYRDSPFEVPRALIEKEIIRLISDPDKEEEEGVHTLDLNPADFEELAHKRMARSLLASAMARHHGIDLDEERLRSRVSQLAGGHPDAQRKINWYYEDRRRMAWIETEVLEYQVVEWILEQAEINDVPTTFDEVMSFLQS